MCDKNLSKFKNWLNIALKEYKLCNYHIEVQGQDSTGDGYSGDINFVKVSGFDANDHKKTLNLVIKSSKGDGKLKELIPLREAYEKEIFIYEVVRKTFEIFLIENGIKEAIDVVPYYYGSVLNDNSDVLIFEDLKIQGFELWDRKLPMTLKHSELVLEAYGRWHAFSLALKTQKPEAFEKLIENNTNMLSKILVEVPINIAHEFEYARNLVIDDNEQDILKHLQFSESDVKYAITDMFFEEPEHQVILHGDCWNSNYLFKTFDDKTNPSEVRVLDWQCSGLASPVFDISQFIFNCVDTERYTNVKELLGVYYNSFSKQLALLGSESEKVYSCDKLMEHWKKFSRYGLFISCWGLRICLKDINEVPDLAESAEKREDALESMGVVSSSPVNEKFVTRVRNNFLFYCNNLET